jgi:hypothetical protein
MHPAFALAWPAPRTSAGPTESWIDASNYTKALTDAQCAELKAAGVVGVIIQAVTGLDGVSYTRQQLEACVRGGLRIQGYVWCTPSVAGGSGSLTRSRLSLFDGFAIEALWLDVEQANLKRFDVDRDLAVCDAYTGRKTGVYSGQWFFAKQRWLDVTWWADRPLWDSRFDGVPVVEANFVPYGGWTNPVVKQFRGTSSIGSIHEIDMDIEAVI